MDLRLVTIFSGECTKAHINNFNQVKFTVFNKQLI